MDTALNLPLLHFLSLHGATTAYSCCNRTEQSASSCFQYSVSSHLPAPCQLKRLSHQWLSPPPTALCVRALLGPAVEVGDQHSSFETFTQGLGVTWCAAHKTWCDSSPTAHLERPTLPPYRVCSSSKSGNIYNTTSN